MSRKRTCFLAAVLVCLVVAAARADVTPASLFREGMVLQQGMKVPVWGTADDGEKVKIEFAGQSIETVAKDGKFRVDLAALKPGGPWPMTITGKNTIKLAKVYVGEVWVCSGQSNMVMNTGGCLGGTEEMKLTIDDLRMITDPHKQAADKPWQPAGGWETHRFSGVGYWFGKAIHDELKVPVGLICCAVGGTPAAPWTPPEILEKQGYKAGRWKPGGLYVEMIKPLEPFAIRGVIWYQGEGNAGGGADKYDKAMTDLITGWRADWGQGDFPFLFVQLPRIDKPAAVPSVMPTDGWALVREAQTKTLALPNTGMAVYFERTDGDLHPKDKKPAGERLALVARTTVYGQKIEDRGPVFKQARREGDKLVLGFDHAEGLAVAAASSQPDNGVKPTIADLAVTDKDGRILPTPPAKIDGSTVVIVLKGIDGATDVYYCWNRYPQGNLVNKAGLPAWPFHALLK